MSRPAALNVCDLSVQVPVPEGWEVGDPAASCLRLTGPHAEMLLSVERFQPPTEEGFDSWVESAVSEAAAETGWRELHRGLLVVDDRPATAIHHASSAEPGVERLLLAIGVGPGVLIHVEGRASASADPLAGVRSVISRIRIV
jgi:hypothetical protein